MLRLRSSARDLAKFLRAQFEPGPLAEAARRSQLPLRAGGNTYLERIGFAWHLLRRPAGRMYKLGQMNGYRGYVELDRNTRRGVIVLAAHHAWPVEQLALALLPRPEPAFGVQTTRASGTGDGAALGRWEGRPGAARCRRRAVRRRAGRNLRVSLRFRATGAITRPYQLFLHADGRGGRLKTDHFPAIPLASWPSAVAIEHTITFRIPDDCVEGPLQLWLGFFDSRGRARVLDGANDGTDRVRGPTVRIKRGS